MSDHGKEFQRSTALHALTDTHAKGMRTTRVSRCATCGEAATYEFNRSHGPIEFYCAAHLPIDALR